MGAVVFAFSHKGPAPRRPWQNHELAEFYRAIDILGRAGLVVVPDMGVSDEGDPWFVFCRDDTGEVLVHFARIDGLLVAASVAKVGVIRGAELRNVIDAVTRLEPLALPVNAVDRRLLLHPAVVLTAFIAAALTFSKHASAHEQHKAAVANPDAASSHISFTKLFSPLKGTPSEAFGIAVPGPSAGGWTSSSEIAGSENAISLGALLSAAMSVIGPVLNNADSINALASSSNLPAAQVDEHSLLSPLALLSSSPVFASALSDDGARSHDLSSETPIVASHWDSNVNATSTALIVVTVPSVSDTLSPQHAISFLPTQPLPITVSSLAENVLGPANAFPHLGTIAMGSGAQQSTAVTSVAFDPTHGFDLSNFSNIALTVLLGSSGGSPPSTSTTSDATSAVGDPANAVVPNHLNAVASSDNTSSNTSTAAPASGTGVATAGITASAANFPTTIVIASNPVEALSQLVDYGLTNHPLNSNLVVSSALASSLPTYIAEVTQPVRLIVFDSSAINLPIFELTKGVVFVSDSQLGVNPSQASSANLVTVDLASGGTMTLLGVVDTAHLPFH